MNQSASEGRPPAGQTSVLPDFILNAAKHAQIVVHTYMHRADVMRLYFPLILSDGLFSVCSLQRQDLDAL